MLYPFLYFCLAILISLTYHKIQYLYLTIFCLIFIFWTHLVVWISSCYILFALLEEQPMHIYHKYQWHKINIELLCCIYLIIAYKLSLHSTHYILKTNKLYLFLSFSITDLSNSLTNFWFNIISLLIAPTTSTRFIYMRSSTLWIFIKIFVNH